MIDRGKLTRFECSDAAEMLSAQNMGGYQSIELHNRAMNKLRNTSDINVTVRYFRSYLPLKQKAKRYVLSASNLLPGEIRTKLRKVNSGRQLK